MKRTIRLTKSELKNMISESVKRKLNEVMGWTLEKEDVTWVNNEESGDKPYMVRLWPGSGYYLPAFGAYAFDEGHALECVVAYLEEEGNNDFFCDDYVEETKQELAEEGKDEEEIEEEINDQFYYVDATMEGASQPHYVYMENLDIYPYDESRFK